MALISGGWRTSSDMVVGTSLVIISLICLVLTPFIFLHKKVNTSLTDLLFKILAVNDFITSILALSIIAPKVLQEDDFVEKWDYLHKEIHPSDFEIAITLLFMTAAITPFLIFGMTTILKFLAIYSPHKTLTIRQGMFIICLATCIELSIIIIAFCAAKELRYSNIIHLVVIGALGYRSKLTLYIAILPCIFQLLAVGASIKIIQYLIQTRKSVLIHAATQV